MKAFEFIKCKLRLYTKHDLLRYIAQFSKFSAVGVGNTIISLSIYYGFIGINPDLYLAGNAVGWVAGVFNAFLWNHKLIFRTKKARKGTTKRRFFRTYVAYALTLVLSSVLMMLFVHVLGILETIAPFLCMAVTIPTNFFIGCFWVYKE